MKYIIFLLLLGFSVYLIGCKSDSESASEIAEKGLRPTNDDPEENGNLVETLKWFMNDDENKAPQTPTTTEPSPPVATPINICDRTEQVRTQILIKANKTDCTALTTEDLKITVLTLSHTNIVSLKPGDFEGLSISTLYLSNNNLNTLPEGVFTGLQNLRRLELGHNQIIMLPNGIFEPLTKLRTLNINNNQLSTLPEGVFYGLQNLERLNLSNNQISALPNGIFDYVLSIEDINLEGNNLSDLERQKIIDQVVPTVSF